MNQIVACEQLLRELENVEGQAEFVDANGSRIGTITRSPSLEDIRIAKERLASGKIWRNAADAIKRLELLEQS